MIDTSDSGMLSLVGRYGHRNVCHQIPLYTEYNHVIFFRIGDIFTDALYPEKEAKTHGGLFDLVVFGVMVFQQSLFWI